MSARTSARRLNRPIKWSDTGAHFTASAEFAHQARLVLYLMLNVLLRQSTTASALALACATALLAARPARAEMSRAPDVVVFTEPTLRPAVEALGALFRARTGAPVRVFAAPSSMLVRVIPHTRDDVMILQGRVAADAAVASHASDAASRLVLGRNHLVVARHGAGGPAPIAQIAAPSALAVVDAPVPDALGALTQAALARANWPGAATRRLGVARSDDAVYLLSSDAAALAVVYGTDVAANASFSVAARLPDPDDPIAAIALLSTGAASANAQAFMDFLRTPQAADTLRAAGLETTAP